LTGSWSRLGGVTLGKNQNSLHRRSVSEREVWCWEARKNFHPPRGGSGSVGKRNLQTVSSGETVRCPDEGENGRTRGGSTSPKREECDLRGLT